MTAKRLDRGSEVTALLGRVVAHMDVAAATGLPAGVYTSPAFYAAETGVLFEGGWLCIGRVDDIPSHGDYLVSDIGAFSIVTVRGQDGIVRSMANTCIHRMTRLLSGKGNCRGRIVCPYHAWTYFDDGRLDTAPQMDKAIGFDPTKLWLRQLRTELWEGFIFATTDPAIASVADRLRPIGPAVGQYHAAGYGKVLDLEMVTEANWKLIHENFMETYHLPFVHRTSLGKQESLGVATGFDSSDAYSMHRTVKHLDSPRGIAHPSNQTLAGEWRRTTVVLCVFPTLLVILCPDHLWYLMTHPIDAGRTRVTFGLSYAPEILTDVGKETLAIQWRPYYVNLNAEDKAIVESIQMAARSPLAAPGRLSPLERFTLDLGRYLVSELGRA